MNYETIAELMERYEQDPAFREALGQDPVGAAEQAGIALDDEVLGLLRIDQSGIGSHPLQQRVSKGRRSP